MENALAFEGFMRDFIDWYTPFLMQVKEFDIETPDTDARNTTETIEKTYTHTDYDPRGIYGVEDYTRTRITKGILPALVEKESELEEKLRELAETYGIGVTPHFNFLNGTGFDSDSRPIFNPQYDLFVRDLEFTLKGSSEQRILAQLTFADSGAPYNPSYCLLDEAMLYFNPMPLVPGEIQINPDWKGSKHPDGNDKGFLHFNTGPDFDGDFYYEGTRTLKFYVNHSLNGKFKLNSPVLIKEGILGSGAVTTFLEMLSEGILITY